MNERKSATEDAEPNKNTFHLYGDLERDFRALKSSARQLRHLSEVRKNQVLSRLAERLLAETEQVLAANRMDLERLSAAATAAFRDRLTLDPKRLEGMAESLRQVAGLADPVGEVVETKILDNGLKLRRVRSPLGVIFMIFESRPNVILEAFSLAFKAGNAIALRGGSESRSTASVFYALMRETLGSCGLETSLFLGIEDYDRGIIEALLARDDLIDIVVPRGGERLIRLVQEKARMPIIKNDRGLCHAYIDRDADLKMALDVVVNGKTQRPGVCNALETILVHADIAGQFLPQLYQLTESVGLLWKADEAAAKILGDRPRIEPARPKDWDTEHLDLILNCRIVETIESALAHIEAHGSRHSETILTRSERTARRFQNEVDAAAVYWNASTRFTDGFEMGLGGELGISTQKLHVRGPVGLRELTTPRWLADGNGQIRT